MGRVVQIIKRILFRNKPEVMTPPLLGVYISPGGIKTLYDIISSAIFAHQQYGTYNNILK